MGGLLFSLVLTLYVMPVIYTYLSRRKDGNVPGKDSQQQRLLPQPNRGDGPGHPTGDTTKPEELEARV